MKIAIAFDKPVNGLSGAEFEIDCCHRLSEMHTCFGSWGLNTFFNVKTGRTDKETISRAKRWIKKHCRKSFTFVETE